MSSGPNVGVIGLGAMGLPMALRLSERFATRGFDPVVDRREAASAAGVSPASTVAEAVREADVVLLATRDRQQSEAALFGPSGAVGSLPAGATVVLTGTVGQSAALDIGGRLRSAGYGVVDAPVSGGPVRAGKGELLIVVGAPTEDLSAAMPVLEQLATRVEVVGERWGDGQLMKAVNQLLAGVHIAAAAEAIALAQAAGLDAESVVRVLSEGAAASFMLSDRGPRMAALVGGADVPVASRVDIFVKDLGIVAELAARAGTPIPVASAAEHLFRIADAAGLGARDDSSVILPLLRAATSPRRRNTESEKNS